MYPTPQRVGEKTQQKPDSVKRKNNILKGWGTNIETSREPSVQTKSPDITDRQASSSEPRSRQKVANSGINPNNDRRNGLLKSIKSSFKSDEGSKGLAKVFRILLLLLLVMVIILVGYFLIGLFTNDGNLYNFKSQLEGKISDTVVENAEIKFYDTNDLDKNYNDEFEIGTRVRAFIKLNEYEDGKLFTYKLIKKGDRYDVDKPIQRVDIPLNQVGEREITLPENVEAGEYEVVLVDGEKLIKNESIKFE